MEIKRGYVKWTDDEGVRHKVPVDEYNTLMELQGAETIDAESAPVRGPADEEVEPNVMGEPAPGQESPNEEVPGTNETAPQRDAEVAEDSFNVSEPK